MAPAARTLRKLGDLMAGGFIDTDRAAMLRPVEARYATALTPSLAALIDRDDPSDPLARQFVPDVREMASITGDDPDPIGDGLKSPVKGLVHRYADRVLLKPTAACAVYCRFCFRREMVGPGGDAMSAADWDAALAYIAQRPEIWEVILTGGDPLFQSNRRIAEATRRLAAIEHVRTLRWHSRVPVAAPERVTLGMAKALTAGHGKAVVVAVHANHPRELSPAVRAALATLRKAGVMLVSQSVLLNGVNDDVATLELLMRGFIEAGVKPYYLHHADRAPGTAHLRTTLADGQALMAGLGARLSGVAMPKYVLDLPGALGKVDAMQARREGALYRVKDRFGIERTYEDMIARTLRPAMRDEAEGQRNEAVNA